MDLLARLFMTTSLVFAEHQAGTARYGAEKAAVTPVEQYGIIFRCDPKQVPVLKIQMEILLKSLGLSPKIVLQRGDAVRGVLQYGLNTPAEDTGTINLKDRAELDIRDDVVTVRTNAGKSIKVTVASKKEILAALMQHGRSFELSGENCSVKALEDHIGMRQSTVIMARTPRDWTFATGDDTRYNTELWEPGWKVKPGVPVHRAVLDPFLGKTSSYHIACNRECRLIMVAGPFYYANVVKKDAVLAKQLEDASKGQPVTGIEPSVEGPRVTDPGKYMDRSFNVPWNNHVPGDWIFIRNKDEVSSDVSGQEGSNSVYLGGNRFKPPIGEGEATLEEKLRTVYSYRAPQLQEKWSEKLYERLRGKTATEEGTLADVRDFVKLFPSP